MLDLNEIKTRPGITEEQRQKLIEDYWREREKEIAYFDRIDDAEAARREVYESPFVKPQCD